MLDVSAKKQLGGFTLDVSLRAPAPGVVALFGRSGCGKTTLIRILAGLLSADSGFARLHGQSLFDTSLGTAIRAERRGIGYVFQDSRLFPHMSVDGNLRFAEKRASLPAIVRRDRVLEMLDLAVLLNRRTHQLSGGERQRVAIGRALLAQPRLLLLDEPLASLDNARREEVLPYLELLRDQLQIPMVYVSHNFEEVLRLATHIVVMDRGRVVAQGDVGAVSCNPHLREFVGAEALGTVVDATVLGAHAAAGLTRVRVGNGELNVTSRGHAPGAALRIQILARDVILATHDPVGLSVRNHVQGTIVEVVPEEANTAVISVNIGGSAILLAHVTQAAIHDLGLRAGLPIWALIKAVSLRSYAFRPSACPRA